MKKVCVVTSTRAEYGLLTPLISKINLDKSMTLQLVVTGTHLSSHFGNTVVEIENDAFPICEKVYTVEENSSAVSIFAKTVAEFEKCFSKIQPDVVIVLGDRSEIMAVSSVCLFMQIPIVHLCGGDTTFGAIDEACRHSISKMASLHFTGNEQMRNRVIQMGENPATVFNTGETGIENILNAKIITREQLAKELAFDICSSNYSLVTFHPVTMEKGSELEQVAELMSALDSIEDMKFIITKANADDGGIKINEYIENFVRNKKKYLFVSSLGMRKYLSALKFAKMMIGNSSSGIIEAPAMKIPTINIGNRQEGREQSESIINCDCKKESIIEAIQKGLSEEFINKTKNVVSVYGDGFASQKMMTILSDFLHNNKLVTKKKFYDIQFKE